MLRGADCEVLLLMNGRKLSSNQLAALTAMAAVVSVAFLFAAYVIPVLAVLCLILASFCMCVPTNEDSYVFAFLLYAVVGAASYFILPEKWFAYLYILLLGHYGIFRAFIAKVQNRLFRTLLKLLYVNAFACLGVYLAVYVFAVPLTLPAFLPVWAAVALLQAAALVYDILYGLFIIVYAQRIRRFLLPR